MVKFQFAIALLLVVIAVLGCEGQWLRARPARLIQRTRKLARQEVEAPVTPYPTADELKPVVPFDEFVPAIDSADNGVGVVPNGPELFPDDVFGPPEVPIVYNSPDEVYGPPEFDFTLPADVAFARQRVRYARLIQARRQAAYRQARLSKLRAVKSAPYRRSLNYYL